MSKDPIIKFDVDVSDMEDSETLKLITGNETPPGEDDDVEFEVELPAKFEVCGTCEGKGTHVNRAIDGNGLSREDFAEDPDFEEAYFRGDYDVQCEECHGQRVVPVVDEDRANPKLLKLYQEHLESEAEMRAEERYWDRLERGMEY